MLIWKICFLSLTVCFYSLLKLEKQNKNEKCSVFFSSFFSRKMRKWVHDLHNKKKNKFIFTTFIIDRWTFIMGRKTIRNLKDREKLYNNHCYQKILTSNPLLFKKCIFRMNYSRKHTNNKSKCSLLCCRIFIVLSQKFKQIFCFKFLSTQLRTNRCVTHCESHTQFKTSSIKYTKNNN